MRRVQEKARPTSEAALEEALEASDGRLVVVCGSIYLVGEVRAQLTRRFGVPRPATEVNVAGIEEPGTSS